jgi:RecA/RadA recombinase
LDTISTGSKAIDSLLGSGVREGMITDVYGEGGSGKSQLCFTLAANCAKEDGHVAFIDTTGTFRPERIVEISNTRGSLEMITFIRALTTQDQIHAMDKIREIEPRLLVVDSLTALFSVEFSGAARHLAVMKHLHELALFSINSKCAVIVTNMVRDVPQSDDRFRGVTSAHTGFRQREYLGSSVSIYSHMKLSLETIGAGKALHRATLVQPPGVEAAEFVISSKGIQDIIQ